MYMTWADKDYKYKKQITIDNSKVAGDEVNYPVLVSVTDDALKDVANGGHVQSSNGYDIVFYDGNEAVLLDHEIQRYVNTTGEIIMWVRLENIYGGVNTIFYMYYGKPGVVIDPSKTTTWDAYFLAVYHMKDATTSSIADSTSNGRTGTKIGANEPIQTDGKIGYAQSFDGVNDVINCGNVGFDPDNITIEAWIYQTPAYGSTYPRVVSKETTTTADPYALEVWNTGRIGMYIGDGAAESNASSPVGSIGLDAWYYVVGTFDDTYKIRMYIDGVVRAGPSSTVYRITDGTNVLIGNNPPSNRDYEGIIDEVRISSIARSDNWILTTFNCQNSPGTFMSFGNEIIRPAMMILTGYLHFE